MKTFKEHYCMNVNALLPNLLEISVFNKPKTTCHKRDRFFFKHKDFLVTYLVS